VSPVPLAPSNQTTRTITEQDLNTNGQPILGGTTVTKN